jgi:arginine vasopressin receptor 1B
MAYCASLSTDSTNVAFTISMLLGNLSSCCNPWIYMGFNSHLLPRPLRHLACCGGLQRRICRQLSNASLSSCHITLLTRSSCPPTLNVSLGLGGRPGPAESLKDVQQMEEEAPTETSIV